MPVCMVAVLFPCNKYRPTDVAFHGNSDACSVSVCNESMRPLDSTDPPSSVSACSVLCVTLLREHE
jgi:hypothetical protein